MEGDLVPMPSDIQNDLGAGHVQLSNTPSTLTPNAAAVPDVIPHPFCTLVLCFDGTGDQFDSDVRPSRPYFTRTNIDNPVALELQHRHSLLHAQER